MVAQLNCGIGSKTTNGSCVERARHHREEDMINRRRLIKLSAATALAPSVACPALGQAAWPSKPVRILIPFTPGGGADTIARFVPFTMTQLLPHHLLLETTPPPRPTTPPNF